VGAAIAVEKTKPIKPNFGVAALVLVSSSVWLRVGLSAIRANSWPAATYGLLGRKERIICNLIVD